MSARVISSGLRVLRICFALKYQCRPVLTPLSRRTLSFTPRILAMKRYTEQHEWISIDDEEIGTVGITEYAANLLGDVVYVELPAVDSYVTQGEELGAVESVKSASDIYAPMSGQVFEVNEALNATPKLINKGAEDEGWICKLALSEMDTEFDEMLTREQYDAFLTSQDHGEEGEEEEEEDEEYEEEEEEEEEDEKKKK